MKKYLTNLLSQPYPFYYQGKELWVLTTVLFGMTLCFGYAFEPFKVYRPEHKMDYFWISFLHACIPVVMVFVFLGLATVSMKKEKRRRHGESWTIQKEILVIGLFLFFVGFAQFLIRDIIYDNPNNWSLRYFLEEIRNTFLVGILFAFILVPINYQRLQARNSKVAKTWHNTTLKTYSTKEKSSYIHELEVDAQHIVYAKADGNYIEIYAEDGNKILKRVTMKHLENLLASYPNFLKTHRSYLVNLEQIASISGNAQGYKLQLKNASDVVPVSRNRITEFNKKWKTS